MVEKVALQLGVSVPFSRYSQTDPVTRLPLVMHPLTSYADHYAEALCREIEAVAADVDRPVGNVRFTGGDPDFFSAGALDGLLGCIEENFALVEGASVTGRVLFSFLRPADEGAMLDVLVRHGVRPLVNVPSFDRDECEELHYPTRFVGLAPLVERMKAAGIGSWGLVLVGDNVQRDAASWERHLRRVLELRPDVVELEVWRPHFKSAGLDGFVAGLLDADYRDLGERRYGLEGMHDGYRLQPAEGTDYLAVGCGACTRLDGCRTWNITDVDEYLRGEGGLEHVIERVEFEDGRVVGRVAEA